MVHKITTTIDSIDIINSNPAKDAVNDISKNPKKNQIKVRSDPLTPKIPPNKELIFFIYPPISTNIILAIKFNVKKKKK